MPYKLQQHGEEWCVVKEGGDAVPGGCHGSRADALKHMRALYVNVPDAKHSAEFSGDTVRRRGKIFAAGDYADKDFTATAPELEFMRDVFSPVPCDLEHIPSILDGKLGSLLSVEVQGEELFGEVEIPSWLHEIHPEPIPVSLTFDRETKEIKKAALVLRPRVEDAALMSAYITFTKRHDTPHGQASIQALHDHAASHGAVCKKPDASMASRHESSAVQQIHDIATEHGARCSEMGSRGNSYPLFSAAESGRGKLTMTVEEIKNSILALFAKGDASGEETPPPAKEKPAENAEMTALKEALATERRKRLEVEAAAFARAEITSKRALPAEETALRAAMFQALTDDEAHGQVTFAEGKTGSRADQLRTLCASRPPHVLFDELAGAEVPADAVLLVNRQEAPGATAEMSEARRKELLSKTPLGQAILNGK